MTLAILPMYDWPGVRDETDALWTAIRTALLDTGLDAPEALTRDIDLMEAWLSPDLLLGQTCGLPFTRALRGRVGVVEGLVNGHDLSPRLAGSIRARARAQALSMRGG